MKKLGPIEWCRAPGVFWFRLFGIGLYFKNLRKLDLLFSERERCRPQIIIGKLLIKVISS